MHVPMYDLAAQTAEVRAELDAAIAYVIDSNHYVLGPVVRAFEEEAAKYLGVRHAIGVASGTDALVLALRAVGVRPGDEVITTPFSFIATAEAIVHAGGTPVFVDVEPGTWTIDPAAVEAAVTPRTRAVLPVQLFGQPADMVALRAICDAHHLALVEDAAQAFGATLNGAHAGALGNVGCFSFYPSKNLGALGDGGLVTTNDDAIAARVRSLREHGHEGGYRHAEVGYNSRLDALQAAVLRVKLRRLDAWNHRRRAIAARYDGWLARAGLHAPVVRSGARHVYHQYTVQTPHRDELRAALSAASVGSVVYYPTPIHKQPSFSSHGSVRLPVAERAAAEVLSLPMFPHLGDTQLDHVGGAVLAAMAGRTHPHD